MRKIYAAALAALMAGLTSQAWALFDVSVFGGYTTVAMDAVNSQMDKINKALNGTETKFGSGYYIGADASIPLLVVLGVGPRVEYISASQAKETVAGYTATRDASLIPVMLGVNFTQGVPLTDFSFKAGLWGGWGFAGAKNDVPPLTYLMDGSGFVGEAMVGARYKVLPLINLGLDLGYRLAKITNMEYSADYGVTKKGDKVKDLDNSDLAYDFSGLNVGLSLNIGF